MQVPMISMEIKLQAPRWIPRERLGLTVARYRKQSNNNQVRRLGVTFPAALSRRADRMAFLHLQPVRLGPLFPVARSLPTFFGRASLEEGGALFLAGPYGPNVICLEMLRVQPCHAIYLSGNRTRDQLRLD